MYRRVSIIIVYVLLSDRFLTLIFYKAVLRHVWGVVGYFIIALLKIYC